MSLFERVPNEYNPSALSRILENLESKITKTANSVGVLKQESAKLKTDVIEAVSGVTAQTSQADGKQITPPTIVDATIYFGCILVVNLQQRLLRRLFGAWRYEWHVGTTATPSEKASATQVITHTAGSTLILWVADTTWKYVNVRSEGLLGGNYSAYASITVSVGTVSPSVGSVVPSADNTYSLGLNSPAPKWWLNAWITNIYTKYISAVATTLATTSIFERIPDAGSVTNSIYSGLRILASRVSDMGDGFGSALTFCIKDDTSATEPIGSIGAIRDGADNTGAVVIRPYNAGTSYPRAKLGYSNSQFGTIDTHYTNFDSTGHQTMVGDARPWRDALTDALNLQKSGTGVALNPTEATVEFASNAAYHATFTSADAVYCNIQLNHDKDLTSSIYPHIHWFQEKAYMPNFLVEYRWQRNGQTKTTGWTAMKCNTPAFNYTPGTTLDQICIGSGISVPSGTNISDIVQFRIYRDTTGVSTTYTGTTCPYNTGGNAVVGVLAFDAHFQINSLGSTDEYTK